SATHALHGKGLLYNHTLIHVTLSLALRACLNFPEIIFYWFYQPVLIFFSVYLPVFIRHIARYAPHKNRQISSKINLKTVSSKI
ncbi:hypothetical protein, partial [Bacteroides heparinolyticus]|uniref:hypothetical protein n=1 Tax=Prevotella heparinolytica TaxID=28113 RepID=UPI00359F52FC